VTGPVSDRLFYSMRILRSLFALIAVVLVSSSCFDGDPFIPQIESVYFDPTLNVKLDSSVKTVSGLYYRDLTVGDGATVDTASGDSVGVRYTGWLRNAEQFDSNISASTPLRFKTGAGGIIRGFDEGVRGMKVNGRRQIIVPPNLGYGASGSGPIPPYSILVFEISLQVIYPPPPPTD
jgi:FKBP-type peptidyl-prolyl cis-trans isomerase